jgi:hypothetical protein
VSNIRPCLEQQTIHLFLCVVPMVTIKFVSVFGKRQIGISVPKQKNASVGSKRLVYHKKTFLKKKGQYEKFSKVRNFAN